MTEPKKFDPKEPLADAEREAEVVEEAQARARLNFLIQDFTAAPAPAAKKRKRLFAGRD